MFLAYATPTGRTLLDRELYLPASWTDDRDRAREAGVWTDDRDSAREAGVPDDVGFATKPDLAARMLTRALDAGVPAAWVTGDEAYGQVGRLRAMLEDRGMSYVLAVPSNQYVMPAGAGAGRIDAAVAALAPQAWTTISVGAGAKGPRVYQWARAAVRSLAGPGYWLLARRSLTDPTDIAYYLAAGPARTPLRELARIAGGRWAIEETFQTAKGEVGLDHYQVRRYPGWYRHITLAVLAHAFLTVTRAATTARKKGALARPGPRRRADPTHPARGPKTACRADLDPRPEAQQGPELVTLATTPPSPRPPLSLRNTNQTHTIPAVVLDGWLLPAPR